MMCRWSRAHRDGSTVLLPSVVTRRRPSRGREDHLSLLPFVTVEATSLCSSKRSSP